MDAEKTTAGTGWESLRSAFRGFPAHWQIASRAIERLHADPRVLGLYLSGSFAKGTPDRWSDIDLYVVAAAAELDAVTAGHERLIREVGDIAAIFPATHLGDPHQIIVFYKGPEPIHVDFQYRVVDALEPKGDDAGVIILLDRTGELERWREACGRELATPWPTVERIQYLEDRFWGWCWYAHAKVERGELWEARDALEYMRSHVLAPLTHREGQVFEGNRRLEAKLSPGSQELLASTVPEGHSVSSYGDALDRSMDAYLELFELIPVEDRAQVRQVDRDYFINAIRKGRRGRRE